VAEDTDATPNLRNLARAISRWENEGGAPAHPLTPPASWAGEVCTIEERILRCLGAAVILEWSDLPTEIQRKLFAGASTLSDPDQQFQLKQLIARFLHVHKDDGGERQ